MRTVIEDSIVREVIDLNSEVYPRLWDAFEALTWWLSHKPDSGELLDDVNWLYKQSGNRDQKIPALVVVYTFDVDCVVLKFILIKLPSL